MKSTVISILEHIANYCIDIDNSINRFGKIFSTFNIDIDYQRIIAFSIQQIGELVNHLSKEFTTQNADYIPFE
jgi:uncharacterized protein with HEPN domain